MAQISVKLIDKSNLGKMLSKDNVRVAVDAALVELVRGAVRVEGEAKRRCPVNFGRLRASITHGPLERVDGVVGVRVGTNVGYARFLEFGTGPRGASTALSQAAQDFMRRIGYKYGSRGGSPASKDLLPWMKRQRIEESMFHSVWLSIRTHGTRAQPFLFPAFERWRNEVADMVQKKFMRVFLK